MGSGTRLNETDQGRGSVMGPTLLEVLILLTGRPCLQEIRGEGPGINVVIVVNAIVILLANQILASGLHRSQWVPHCVKTAGIRIHHRFICGRCTRSG